MKDDTGAAMFIVIVSEQILKKVLPHAEIKAIDVKLKTFTLRGIKGGLTCKNNILFYWLFLNLGLSTVRKNFSRFFVAVVSAEIEVKNCMRSSTSACALHALDNGRGHT